MIRKVLQNMSVPAVWALKPVRRLAWTTKSTFIRGVILEMMTLLDTVMVVVNVQNGALLLNYRSAKGNFFFGKSLMVVSHEKAAEAVVKEQLRGSYFMGLPIVAFAPPALIINATPTAVSQPARGVLRKHMNEEVLTDAHRDPDLNELRVKCAPALKDWAEDPKRDTLWSLRGTVTQVLSIILADIYLPKKEADDITAAYIRRFAELSAFQYFAPFILGFLGTEEKVRNEVFIPMKRRGMNPLVVDMVLFAGMFSVGTITMKCVENTREYDIDYASLSDRERIAFVVESIRLWPTVSTVHRIVEEPEEVEVDGTIITVPPGREIAYPFVCINRDPEVFSDPETFSLNRPPEEVAEILSWSRGEHQCPAKNISILATVLMLDTLAKSAGDLRHVRIDNFEV